MDASELEEIAFHRQNGRPETTRGPYYHKTWWEAYKGAVKGILGGIVIGGIVGAAAGGVVVGVLAATGGLSGIAAAIGGATTTTAVGGTILAATSFFGMYEGEKKFESVGITTGAVAAGHEISEVRMKEYMRDKLTELTNEVRELKAAVAGKIPVQAMHTNAAREDTAAIFDESDFHSTHQTSEHQGTKGKILFWNVAAIGALVGAVVMGVAAAAGLVEPVLHHIIGMEAAHAAAAASSATPALIASGAALGGSFGINRDIFRKIFDVTDCWFMGVADGKCASEEIAKAKGVAYQPLEPRRPHSLKERQQLLLDKQTPGTEISNVYIVEPQTTYFQEKPSPEVTKMAILGMDHTNAIRH